MDKIIKIHTEFITLGQALKIANIVQSGGESKAFLLSNAVFVNDVQDQRRGKKLYPGDKIKTGKYELAIEKC